jgi:hypothetical protein
MEGLTPDLHCRRISRTNLRSINENAWSSGIIHIQDSRYMMYFCCCCGTCIQVYLHFFPWSNHRTFCIWHTPTLVSSNMSIDGDSQYVRLYPSWYSTPFSYRHNSMDTTKISWTTLGAVSRAWQHAFLRCTAANSRVLAAICVCEWVLRFGLCVTYARFVCRAPL